MSHTQAQGTLRAGFELRNEPDTPWERAVYVAFVVAKVHPFDDGNGRVARVMMNAELAAPGENRIIIPTAFRQDYLDGLRRLSRQEDPSVLIKAMRFAHDFTASVDLSDDTPARRMLAAANAFNEPDSGDRLRIPERPGPWEAVQASPALPIGHARSRTLPNSTAGSFSSKRRDEAPAVRLAAD